MISLENELRVAMKTGKVVLGSRQTARLAAHGRGKLIIIARNCPEDIKALIMHYAKLSNIPTYICPLSSKELGEACGRRFMVAALTVLDEGESDIMKLVEGEA
ncbi:50S ribosomal protein L30e [Candidatus Geothermarchaeota archaeon ex4572_27]|nr:MAG: 50S ribosomal protein L30e [Candidatus Geothermarchaeota archaeon ex4572_27]